MSTLNAQGVLLDIAWVRSNTDPGEDPLALLARKQIDNRREDAMRQKDYWERQIMECEKELDKLDKQAERRADDDAG